MRTIIISFIALLIIFLTLPCYGQIGPVKNTVIPPSPTSSVYRQFTGYVPDIHTGSVNIPLPLYEIKLGSYTIPLSLQYFTSGIKVDATPYPVGYGWIFSPGLRLTRTVMGRPDVNYKMDIEDSDDFEYLRRAMYNALKGEYGTLQDSSMRDTQYDIFTVHLPSGSSSFILKNNGTAYQAESTNNLLKIELLDTNLRGFKVTDDRGVIYYFGDIETSNNITPLREYTDYQYVTGWMLRKIVLPGTGNEINFTWGSYYHSGISFGTTLGANILKDWKSDAFDYQGSDQSPTYEAAQDVGLLTGGWNYQKISHIQSITFPSGRVAFSYSGGSNPLITDISVYNINETLIRNITLTYGTNLSAGLLQSVYITGEGTYSFIYNSHRFENYYAQDYWGYYNGKNNQSLPPQLNLKVYNGQYGSTNYYTYGYADRSIDTTAMKANILTKIKYPTGGHTEFEYEPHEFTGTAPTTSGLGAAYRFALYKGGGLRVRKMTSTDPNTGISIVKRYKYGNGENGKGNIMFEPTLDTFVDEFYAYDSFSAGALTPQVTGANFRLLFVNTHSYCEQYNINSPNVWYDTVTEYNGDESKTIYTYSQIVPQDIFASNYVVDFAHRSIFSYRNIFSKGILLTNKKEYKKSSSGYSLLRETIFDYNAVEETTKMIESMFVNRTEVNIMSNGPDFDFTTGGHVIIPDGSSTVTPVATYERNPYTIRFYYEELQSITTSEYTDEGTLTRVEKYYYSNYLLRNKINITSKGDTITTIYSYPMDYANVSGSQQPVLQAMFALNMNVEPFKSEETLNGSSMTTINEYSLFSGSNLYLPVRNYFKKGSGSLVCQNEYDYDTKGNIRSITSLGEHKKSYLWSYASNYPVMEIEGKTYSEVLSMIGSNTIATLAASISSSSIISITDGIRSQIGTSALVSSYTYIPLVGISSIKDLRGQNTTYHYDSSWRLKKITDNNNYKIAMYANHLAGQTLSVSFSASSSYSYGTTADYIAVPINSSENCTYQWILKNSSGTNIYTSSLNESPNVAITLSHPGSMILTCNMTDLMTGTVATYSNSFTVTNPVIKFSNISSGNNQLYANISIPESASVTFYLDYSLSSGAYAEVYMKDELLNVSGTSSQEINKTVEGLNNSFSIIVYDGSPSDYISIVITNVSSPYVTNSPSSIGLVIN